MQKAGVILSLVMSVLSALLPGAAHAQYMKEGPRLPDLRPLSGPLSDPLPLLTPLVLFPPPPLPDLRWPVVPLTCLDRLVTRTDPVSGKKYSELTRHCGIGN